MSRVQCGFDSQSTSGFIRLLDLFFNLFVPLHFCVHVKLVGVNSAEVTTLASVEESACLAWHEKLTHALVVKGCRADFARSVSEW